MSIVAFSSSYVLLHTFEIIESKPTTQRWMEDFHDRDIL